MTVRAESIVCGKRFAIWASDPIEPEIKASRVAMPAGVAVVMVLKRTKVSLRRTEPHESGTDNG